MQDIKEILTLDFIPEHCVPDVRDMLEHWYSPNKREELIQVELKNEDTNKYHIQFRGLLFEVFDNEEGVLIVDRFMAQLLDIESLVIHLDDITSIDSITQLVKYRHNRFTYHYKIPVGSSSQQHARKVVTLMSNTKHRFLTLDTSEATEAERVDLTVAFLESNKDFYTMQVLNTVKMAIASYLQLDIEHKVPFLWMNKDNVIVDPLDLNLVVLAENPRLITNLISFMVSLPVSLEMFKEGKTLEQCSEEIGSEINNIEATDDVDYLVPAVIQFLLEDKDFVYAVCEWFQKEVPDAEKVYSYFLAENKDYIFSGKNLYRLLSENGYLESLES